MEVVSLPAAIAPRTLDLPPSSAAFYLDLDGPPLVTAAPRDPPPPPAVPDQLEPMGEPQPQPQTPSAEAGPCQSIVAAVKLQKTYRSYRTRRRLADSAVVAEELWWQALDFARLNHSTISFFDHDNPESPHSKWHRITENASKVGKGLAEDEGALKLAFQHWIEAIDPRHRYGHNLHYYYEEWCKSDAGQPFFYWLDVGDGKNVDLDKCPRSRLREQIVVYLGPQERQAFEYVAEQGIVVNKVTGEPLDTSSASQTGKWIFVMSTSKKLYAGQKRKGRFHHSSFLAGGATIAAGRLRAEKGVLKSISAYSGHYKPTEENLNNFLDALTENGIDRDAVKIEFTSNEDYYDDAKITKPAEEGVGEPGEVAPAVVPAGEDPLAPPTTRTALLRPPQLQLDNLQLLLPPPIPTPTSLQEHHHHHPPTPSRVYMRTLSGGLHSPRADVPRRAILQRIESKKKAMSYQLGHQLSSKWTTGAGPRIGCVADYPREVRDQALQFVNLSPRIAAVPTPGSVTRFPGHFTSPPPRQQSSSPMLCRLGSAEVGDQF